MTTNTLIPIADVAKRLGIVAEDIRRGLYGVTVSPTWDGRPAITEKEATRLRDELSARFEANRERKREEAARKIREAEMFNNDRERRFWTAYAAVIEDNGPTAHRDAPGIALSVIEADDPESALQRVIRNFGKPSEHAIMFVMGRAKDSSATHREKGRPSWMQ